MPVLTAVADPSTASVRLTVDYTSEFATMSDTFTARTILSGWGTSTSGHLWQINPSGAGEAPDYSVSGGVGIHTMDQVGSGRRSYSPNSFNPLNVSEAFTFDIPSVPTGAGYQVAGIVRLDPGAVNSNFYYGIITFNTDGTTMSAAITKRVAGVDSAIGPAVTIATVFPPYAGGLLRMRFEVLGNRLRLRVWDAALAEPSYWNLTLVDPVPLMISGLVGIRTILNAGNLNTLPMNFTYDNFIAEPAGRDTVTIWRVTPDGVRTAVMGMPIRLTDNRAVVYDVEAPLNTSIYYVIDDGYTQYNSNSVTLATGRDGWLKDPYDNANSMRLDNCVAHSPQCLDVEANAFFQSLENEGYDNASGIFARVDTARPITISMARKALTATLTVVTRRLDDIPRMERLLAPGRVLLLQLPMEYGWGLTTWGTDYVAIEDVSVERLGADMGKPYRVWRLPFSLTIPTSSVGGLTGGNGVGVPGATWGDLTATGHTWGTLNATGNTWLEVAQGDFF